MASELYELKEKYSVTVLGAVDGVYEGHPVGISISLEQFEDCLPLLDQLHNLGALSADDLEHLKSMMETVIKILRKNLLDERKIAGELMETIITKSRELGLIVL